MLHVHRHACVCVCVCVCVKEQRGDVIHVKELMASTNNIVHALAR